MEYINKDLGSFNLHMIKTKKFKTISVRVVFHTPIIKEEITMRNLVTDILIQSSKEYPTRRDLTMKAEDLYAAEIWNKASRKNERSPAAQLLRAVCGLYRRVQKLAYHFGGILGALSISRRPLGHDGGKGFWSVQLRR